MTIALNKCEKIETLNVLNRVRTDPDLQPIKTLLQLQLDYFRKANDDAEGKQLHQQQGVCQFIGALQALIEDAPNILEKIRNQNEQRSYNPDLVHIPLTPGGGV